MLENFTDTAAFVRVVQHGSFTAAAAALQVPKARVSRKVMELEARLGATLLKRTTRRLGLTEAGRRYFDLCEPLLDGLKDAEQAVAALGERVHGRLRITAPSWIAAGVLAPLLVDFQRLHPDLAVDVRATSEPLDLVSGDVDLALRLWMGDLPSSALTARRIGRLAMHVYAAPLLFVDQAVPEHPDDLAELPALVISGHGRSRAESWRLISGGAEAECPIRMAATSDDPEVLRRMMLAGGGVMLATELQMRDDVVSGVARIILPAWHSAGPDLYAVMPAGRVQPLSVRTFLDFLLLRLRLEEGAAAS